MSTPSERRGPIDFVDDIDPVLDQLRTIWLALHAKSLLSDDLLDAVTNSVNDAANCLEGIRDRLSDRVKEGDA